MSAPAIVPVRCGYQPYAWGKPGDTSKVADLIGEQDPTKRYAELWIGTHPSKPAVLQSDPSTTLKTYFERHGEEVLGAEQVKKFGQDIPFLLKVLSIDMALSIQAHPVKEHAAQLHSKDPKNYPDDNHKPELVVALTPFQALCCFRPLEQVKEFVKSIPPLAGLLVNSQNFQGATAKENLRGALADLYGQQVDAIANAIDIHKRSLENLRPEEVDDTHKVFLRVESQFPNDVGCWMVYFLNIVNLQPGDGLFMAPNEPHSYLMGDCVEIMAASDNVVRAGLTPKFKDVEVLLDMLTYRTDALDGVSYKNDADNSVQRYVPPEWCEEFSLTAVRLGSSRKEARLPALPSASMGVVVSGSVVIAGEKMEKGQTFMIPASSAASEVTVQLADGASDASVYIGSARGNSPATTSRL
jgi:mannose-6-phosphate isomerase